MRVEIQYNSKKYGMSHHSKKFKVKSDVITGFEDKKYITLRFEFDSDVMGRGLNINNVGLVESVEINFTESEARILAITILSQLENITQRSRVIKF